MAMERQEKNKLTAKMIATATLIIGIVLVIMGAFFPEKAGIVLRTFSTLGAALAISALITLFVC